VTRVHTPLLTDHELKASSGATSAASSSVADVIARMEAILGPLSRTDGVACFTRLYLNVTKAVQTELESATFADPGFLQKLDVVFADLFFGALEAHQRGPGRHREHGHRSSSAVSPAASLHSSSHSRA
jgi:Family of unknown function (DUF5995)